MIDSTFIQKIAELGRDAASPIHKVPGDNEALLVRGPDGGFTRYDLPVRRNHIAGELTAIIDLYNRFDEAEIWYSRKGIVVVIETGDDVAYRDRATLPLTYSPQLALLQEWEAGRCNVYSQAPAVLTIRTVFRRCLGKAGNLEAALKNIKFLSAASGSSAISHGKASVGKQIETQVAGVENIPEQFTLQVPVFNGGFASIQDVEVAIDLDPATQNIKFIPIPGDVEAAIGRAEAHIGTTLAEILGEKGTKVYLGQP